MSRTPPTPCFYRQENARLYAGSEELMTDPIASPLHATRAALAHLPPLQIHVGLSEVLVSENVLFATRAPRHAKKRCDGPGARSSGRSSTARPEHRRTSLAATGGAGPIEV